MRKIIFVDHIYHSKTRSSNFLQDLLSEEFRVALLYVDPEAFDLEDLREKVRAEAEPDSIIYVWQLDFLAPIFLALGYPVVCSPMYDGSGVLPKEHWKLLSDVRFVNFSVNLHEKARAAGAKSFYAKYFPEPKPQVDFGTGLRGFFWRRRPEHGLDIGIVDRIFGSQLTSLHIHDSPDTAEGKAIPLETGGLRYPVTRSTWFDDAADMRAVMERCNFYIAPRLSEGIGMGFLEAMAAGMLVAAHDAPTHDEYIVTGLNGILFSRSSQDIGYLHEPERMAVRGRKAMLLGHENWRAARHGLCDFVARAEAPATPPLDLAQAEELVAAYRGGLTAYLAALQARLAAAAAARAKDKPRDKARPRVLLGHGFHRVENPSARYFPVRVVWTSDSSFTIVPLDETQDIELIFRSGRSNLEELDLARRFSAARGEQSVPLQVEPFPHSSFFRVILKAGTFRAYESLQLQVDWPLFEVGPGAPGSRRKQGLLLCEDGVELLQM